MSLDKLIQRHVVTRPPTASCREAAELMRDRNVGSIVVVEGEEPIGVVTDRDLVTRVIAQGRDPALTVLRDAMSPSPIFLSQRRSLDEAVDTMRDLGVRRLPIVDTAQRLIGIISLDDVLIHLGHQLDSLGRAVQRELGPTPTR